MQALFELRAALECAAAELAASRRTEADVVRLRAVCERVARGRTRPGERFPYRLDLAFHQALLDAARSPRIAEQVRLVQQRVVLLRSAPATTTRRTSTRRWTTTTPWSPPSPPATRPGPPT